ncbi:LysE family translocator [Fontisubflavum oceani]|uniref:LysE family translocator n=1 Tax=Fontisubflavum oceani TaxID=2978973 RepID=UPI0025B28532|nr:LysE family translocator [Fontisubflavum oceani]WJY21187.1 LysE family translocator [Fontisubflavum oceani]
MHALAAALGISAIVAASPTAFDILQYAGAAYLAYLGVQALRSWWNYSNNLDPSQAVVEISAWSVFRRGLITNVLNPKVIVFYLALLPQFISVELGNVGLQIFLLGCIHNVFVVNGATKLARDLESILANPTADAIDRHYRVVPSDTGVIVETNKGRFYLSWRHITPVVNGLRA